MLIGLALGLALGLIAGFFVFRKKDAGSLEIDLATAKANEASLREQITSMQSQQEETGIPCRNHHRFVIWTATSDQGIFFKV